MSQDSEEIIEERNSPSAWTRLPKDDEDDSPDERSQAVREDAISKGLKAGLSKASSLIESGREDFDRLLFRSDLPELGDKDPLTTLGIRLDREADLWRGFALGELSRAAWVDRLAQAISVIGFLGTLALAAVGGIGAMLGFADAMARLLLVAIGVVAVAVGAGMVAWVGSNVRKSHQKAAREALVRADLAELRLHRVAVVLALQNEDNDTYQKALVRLERDASAPSK